MSVFLEIKYLNHFLGEDGLELCLVIFMVDTVLASVGKLELHISLRIMYKT